MVLHFKGCAINDLNIQRSNSQMFLYAAEGQRWFHTEHFKLKVLPFHRENTAFLSCREYWKPKANEKKANQILTIPMTFLVYVIDSLITSLNEIVIKWQKQFLSQIFCQWSLIEPFEQLQDLKHIQAVIWQSVFMRLGLSLFSQYKTHCEKLSIECSKIQLCFDSYCNTGMIQEQPLEFLSDAC